MIFGLCLGVLVYPPAAPGEDGPGGRLCLKRRLGLPCTNVGCGCRCDESASAKRAGGDVDARLDREVERYTGRGRGEATGAEGVAASFGAGYEATGVQPYMIGDFFGGGATVLFQESGPTGTPLSATLPLAAGDRRLKVTENNSPLPADRVFMNYQHFANALDAGNTNTRGLDRYVFGIEKAFGDGHWSVELRLPFAAGLDSTQMTNTPLLTEGAEFGNLAFIFKGLLWRSQTWSAGAGLALTLPTAGDVRISGPSSLVVENEAVHLLPFVGLQYTPNERFWMLTFVHADFDANGNPVTFTGAEYGYPYTPGIARGVLQDQNLLHLDASWGYWLYRDPAGDRLLSGLAPMLELHYSTTMQPGDFVMSNRLDGTRDAAGAFTTLPNGQGFAGRRQDTLNLTGALRFQIGRRSTLTVAGVAPLLTGDDKPFDAEFITQYIWRF